MAHIVLIAPRFELSFWNLSSLLELNDKKAVLPLAALPLLAALTPSHHTVELMDERVAPLDWERIAQADIVGLTGMSVQRKRMKTIATEIKKRGKLLVIGGPWITLDEHYFGELPDVIFVGEADTTWPQFLQDFEQRTVAARYEQEERTDMETLPVPRWDLLQMDQFQFGSLQISRGCPYRCEFCDIIVTFGRRPRLKNAEQVLAEIEALRATGRRSVFVVDDNLIGNRRKLRPILEAIIDWQRREQFPLKFFTEASLDLAEDEGLMELMVQANFQAVFIGIESPNAESLEDIKKGQNVRAQKHSSRTMIERVEAIQDTGLEVWSGMIVGFDHDDETIFDATVDFLELAAIPWAMIGMLAAFPKTPLYDRLVEEGRLDFEDDPPLGTNVHPKRMTREALSEGYKQLLLDAYHPDNYFKRVDRLHLQRRHDHGIPKRHPFMRRRTRLKHEATAAVRTVVGLRRLTRMTEDRALARRYRRQVMRMAATGQSPELLWSYTFKCMLHQHFWTLSQQVAAKQDETVNSF